MEHGYAGKGVQGVSDEETQTTAGFLSEMKRRGEPIAMLTCYDFPTAVQQDASDVDIILVGDSVGINILGYESPQQVTMADMLHHTRAVRRGVRNAILLADLPYRSYETDSQAVDNARLLADAGADMVKLEGAGEVAGRIEAITADGTPVVGHVGHLPQTWKGNRHVYGDRAEEAARVLAGALALEASGAVAVVLECVPEQVAGVVSRALSIPTIGIGSGRRCDGQVLVAPDLLGLNDFSFRYSKRYAELGRTICEAFTRYVNDVKEKRYPAEEHRYRIRNEELRKFKALAEE
ncbi:MAG: 3-methyl-2-oxobutanoate hydroxymethyltransferase [Gemmatimonadota bacterium]|nr:3-methyl-2-oxobutanoate hydroxymethyltransferase [Gemmatimonadota bacterium]